MYQNKKPGGYQASGYLNKMYRQVKPNSMTKIARTTNTINISFLVAADKIKPIINMGKIIKVLRGGRCHA